jgi:hypothetical protein
MQYTFIELITGILITEWTFIFAARTYLGKKINEWYTRYGVWAVLADITSICFGIVLAMYFYRGNSFLVLMGIAVLIQWIHDILFYHLVILPVPPNTNEIIDLLKEYAKDVKILGIVGDSWMIIGSLLATNLVSNVPYRVQTLLLLFSAYMLPYAIYQKPSIAS